MIRYKRVDLSELEYECLIKSIDFEKLEAFDKTIIPQNVKTTFSKSLFS